MTRALITTAALLLLLPAVGQAQDGAALYETHCARCHGKTGAADTWRGRLMFATNLGTAAFQQRNSNADILAAIERGPGLMPAFAETLSLDERKALVQVVRRFSAGSAAD
jgi:mono/diheme cytochrome c family protein